MSQPPEWLYVAENWVLILVFGAVLLGMMGGFRRSGKDFWDDDWWDP